MSTRESQRSTASAAANISRRMTRLFTGDKGGPNVVGTGISFTAADTIGDTGNGLALFGVGEMVQVLGSPLNSRPLQVVTSAAGSLTVLPAVVQSEVAGASIRLVGG